MKQKQIKNKAVMEERNEEIAFWQNNIINIIMKIEIVYEIARIKQIIKYKKVDAVRIKQEQMKDKAMIEKKNEEIDKLLLSKIIKRKL